MSLKWLIVGRTASGKDTLARLCEANGMTLLRSYTTRPRRNAADDGHTFVTDDEAAAIPEDERVAETHIAGHDYFMTRQQVRDSDVIIIDPEGLDELLRAMPETQFAAILVVAPDDVRRARYDARGGSDVTFDEREASEHKRFDGFRDRMAAHDYPNLICVYQCENGDDDTSCVSEFASFMSRLSDGIVTLLALDERYGLVDWERMGDESRESVMARVYVSDHELATLMRAIMHEAF